MNLPTTKQHTVSTCTARRNGNFLIVTTDGKTADSARPYVPGDAVLIDGNGEARRPGRGE